MSEPASVHYDTKEVEDRIYSLWKSENAFSPAFDENGTVRDAQKVSAPVHTMVIPPPNVTGRLHMGHALNNSIQDMITRYKRMDGFDALWVPGTDHAGIATQTVVKKMLDAQGIDYRTLGREKFTENVWTWKEKYGSLILHQLEKIGASCDWKRTRFTMDDGLSLAVRTAFKKLHADGLIYRGRRIVNWCPVDRTALSDDEIETKEGGEPGFLWHIKYPFADGQGSLTVATTRPETLFGDVAVAVNPKDERYINFVGKKLILPLSGREIPVIADEYVDMAFGTGCLKITPAHDPNDFEVGTRHNFEPIDIMNEDATMNSSVPAEYRGMTREKCRLAAVAELKKQNLLIKEEPRMTPVGRSYRSRAAIEYRLSDQWFVKMKPLAQLALKHHDSLKIYPERWDKVYKYWLANIRDWCISRQIWWGHRIPAWYNLKTGETLVDIETPEQVKLNPADWKQDEDVLDTWFSSGLWPMSTLGWPEESSDLKRYFPTTTLSTAKDILFFWVARMNIMSLYLRGVMPYTNVYIHPTVMDDKGETMSKSKGNGIDPLHIIGGATCEDLKAPIFDARPANMKELIARVEKKYPDGFPGVGADAMRYTLIHLCSSGQEMKLSMDNFIEVGRRFTTKLWNAARFVLMHLETSEVPKDYKPGLNPRDEDIWIGARIKETADKIRNDLAEFDFIHLGDHYHKLVWNDFCDWYVELCKVRLNSSQAEVKADALHFLIKSLSDILKLLHPLTPFITEELFSKIRNESSKKNLWQDAFGTKKLLMLNQFPQAGKLTDVEISVTGRFYALQNIISSVRVFRAASGVAPKQKIKVCIKTLSKNAEETLRQDKDAICEIGGLESIQSVPSRPAGCSTVIDPQFEIYIPLSGTVDVKAEIERLKKEHQKALKDFEVKEKKLSNPGFLERAEPDLVESEKNEKKFIELKIQNLEQLIRELSEP